LVFGLSPGANRPDAGQFGLSLLVWGAAVRTVLVLHFTWLVNSAAHLWGYRNYDTPDDSRNNIWVAILAAGEGWHNNHHADPRSAARPHVVGGRPVMAHHPRDGGSRSRARCRTAI